MGQCICTCKNKDKDLFIFDIAIKHCNNLSCKTYQDNKNVLIHDWINEYFSKIDVTHWIIYNDNGISNKGHCKGIFAWNCHNNNYIWLVHSIPHFPESIHKDRHIHKNNHYIRLKFSELPESARKFGQSCFIIINKCNNNEINNICKMIFQMDPHINNKISSFNFQDNVNNKNITCIKLTKDIMHLSKPSNIHIDIYQYLQEKYGGNLELHTWIRGHQEDIHEHIHDNINTHDHSKICISDKGWIFIGDLNHMKSQRHRGGGGVIINSSSAVNFIKNNIK